MGTLNFQSSIGKALRLKPIIPQNQGLDENIKGSGRGHSADYFYPYYGKWRMTEGHPWIEWNTVIAAIKPEVHQEC